MSECVHSAVSVYNRVDRVNVCAEPIEGVFTLCKQLRKQVFEESEVLPPQACVLDAQPSTCGLDCYKFHSLFE